MKTEVYIEQLKARRIELQAAADQEDAKFERALRSWVPRFKAHLRGLSWKQIEEIARGHSWTCWRDTAIYDKAPKPPEKPEHKLLGSITGRILHLERVRPQRINPDQAEITKYFGTERGAA